MCLQLIHLRKLTGQLALVISSSESLYSTQITIESKDTVLKENLVVQSYFYCKSAETAIKMKWYGKDWLSASMKNRKGTDTTF